MRIWLVCFGVLFALVELYQWVEHLTLPLPVYILGGTFLAIASNYNKLSGWHEQELVAQSPRPISFKIRQLEQHESEKQ